MTNSVSEHATTSIGRPDARRSSHFAYRFAGDRGCRVMADGPTLFSYLPRVAERFTRVRLAALTPIDRLGPGAGLRDGSSVGSPPSRQGLGCAVSVPADRASESWISR